MLAMREEELDMVYGGTEFPPENGSSGGGDRIQAGDWVTWNGHENLGKGLVGYLLWGYAFVTFQNAKSFRPIHAIIEVKNLCLVR